MPLFPNNPAKRQYFNVIYKDPDGTELGLLQWMKEEMEELTPPDMDVRIFIGGIDYADIYRKGSFPSIHIYPSEDEWEGLATGLNQQRTTLKIIVGIKGDHDYVNEKTIEFTSNIYDFFRTTTPPISEFICPPSEGEIEFVWEKHDNIWVGFSTIELVYEWQLSNEKK